MAELVETPITVIHVVICLVLMLVILIQPGKSGGLGAALGGAGAQQLFGGRGAGNFLTRTTWIGVTLFFLTSTSLAYIATSTGDSLEDVAAEAEQPSEPRVEAAEGAQQEAARTDDSAADSPASGEPGAADRQENSAAGQGTDQAGETSQGAASEGLQPEAAGSSGD